jgi:hypothetical protein
LLQSRREFAARDADQARHALEQAGGMRLGVDRGGELVPAAGARCNRVPGAIAIGIAREHQGRQRGQPACRRWTAHLVLDDAQLLALRCKAQCGAQEVLPARGIHPGGAQDHVPAAALAHGDLACQFALAVDRQRRGRVVLAPGAIGHAGEDIVGRIVDQSRPSLAAGGREFGNRLGIDAMRQLGFVLGAIDGGVRDGVEHQLRLLRPDQRRHRARLGEVGLRATLPARHHAAERRGQNLTQWRAGAMQFVAELAVGAQ